MRFDEGPARPVPRSVRFPFTTHRTLAATRNSKKCWGCDNQAKPGYVLCSACMIDPKRIYRAKRHYDSFVVELIDHL